MAQFGVCDQFRSSGRVRKGVKGAGDQYIRSGVELEGPKSG